MIRPSVSQDFENRLHQRFDGRVRLRWSNRLGEWHLEYKIAPGKVLGYPLDSQNDHAIRARDGYAFIMAVRTGDRMPCPECGFTLHVPLFKTAEVTCTYCTSRGRDGRWPAAYYPLEGDALLTHLSHLDPLRGYNLDVAKRVDDANQRLLAQQEREFEVYSEAAVKDHFYDLAGIPRVSMGGKSPFTR